MHLRRPNNGYALVVAHAHAIRCIQKRPTERHRTRGKAGARGVVDFFEQGDARIAGPKQLAARQSNQWARELFGGRKIRNEASVM